MDGKFFFLSIMDLNNQQRAKSSLAESQRLIITSSHLEIFLKCRI